jgi:hypothetical protein
MTYQSFSVCNPLNTCDEGCNREFKIIIPENKCVTQDEIYFNIEYTNINYNKIECKYDNCFENIKSLCFDKNVESLKEYKTKINELIDSTIKDIENEHSLAPLRQTPLFMFQNIQLFVNNNLVARRMFNSLDEMIINGCLYINQIFPGIKFKYTSDDSVVFRFTRAPIKNECLKFECYYNCSDLTEKLPSGLITGYKEYLLPAGLNNIEIEKKVKSFKMIPCVNSNIRVNLEYEDYILQAERLIKECYNNFKFKYYKDGLKINETEFGTSPGLYHIEILNKDDFNNADFYSIDYKIICEC